MSLFFLFKQKTAYEMRISDWSSDVCSSDLTTVGGRRVPVVASVVDQQAALYGHGCREAGDAKITFGTGAFTLMVTGTEILRAPEQGLLPTVAWQIGGEKPVYALDGGVYTASAAVNWGRSLGLFESFRSEEHTSELQSLMRISYAVFCLKKKTTYNQDN